jgi:hypothetical protein
MRVVLPKLVHRCSVAAHGWICENEEQLAKLINDMLGREIGSLELVESPRWKEGTRFL